MKKTLFIIYLAFLTLSSAWAQEILAPLSSRQMPLSQSSVTSSFSKTQVILELPFFDDFSNYEGIPDPARWATLHAFVNKDYAPEPPTVGMVTLDALDANGDLYPHASTNLFAADTLASQIIRLDSLTGAYQQKLQPSDSIILSFYYLPGGWYGNLWELVGDTPSQQDSLFLEFYDMAQDCWNIVWATPGFSPDTAGRHSLWPWRYASVKIDDIRYLSSQFQFRFRNYASLDPNPKSGIAGNCDQWNIDYIYLNRNRTVADSFFRDIAFVEKAPSLLSNYQSMPASQFQASDMNTRLQMKIVNRYNQTLASNYSYSIFNSEGQRLGGYDGGFENIPAFFPNGQYQPNAVHCNPPVNYTFPQSTEPSEYRVVHVVREGVGGDNHTCNDTVVFNQIFDNYYAYDDGIPENGYGLTAPSNKMWLAIRFDLNSEDTLTAIDLFFNRTRNAENESIPFHLCIWNCENGQPHNMIYKDSIRQMPHFDGFNHFHRYKLHIPQIVEDTIFVGIEQLSNGYINLGFDRSNDAHQYTWSRTGNEWMQSYLRGAVMMRPVFGSRALVGIDKPNADLLEPQFSVFPNPSHGQVSIDLQEGIGDECQIKLFDMKGRCVLDSSVRYGQTPICLSLDKGIYIIQAINKTTGICSSKKIVVN